MTKKEAIAAIKTLCHTCKFFPKCVNDKPECFQAIEMAIEALKQPEIIYCKHCKHRTFHDNRISSEQCYVCDYWDFDDPQPNGFCNFAEMCEE